jgi:hypothetical protein
MSPKSVWLRIPSFTRSCRSARYQNQYPRPFSLNYQAHKRCYYDGAHYGTWVPFSSKSMIWGFGNSQNPPCPQAFEMVRTYTTPKHDQVRRALSQIVDYFVGEAPDTSINLQLYPCYRTGYSISAHFGVKIQLINPSETFNLTLLDNLSTLREICLGVFQYTA